MEDEWQTVNGPEGPLRFPKGMSREEMAAAIEERYRPTVENPGPDVDQDVSHSVLQGLRDVGETIAGAPGIADDLERAAVDWLKASGGGGQLWQSLGVGDVLKRTGENYEAIGKKLGFNEEMDLPFPDKQDVQWLEKQLGAPDPYQPQTGLGNAMRYGTGAAVGGLAGGQLMPNFGSWARSAINNPITRNLAIGGIKGLGLGAGGYGGYHLTRGVFDR